MLDPFGEPARMTRRDLIARGAQASAGISVAASLMAVGCSSGGDGGGTNVAVLQGLGYLGYPGSMQKFWRDTQKELSTADAGVRISGITNVPVGDLITRLRANHQAKRGPNVEEYFPDWAVYEFVAGDALAPLDDLVGEDARQRWLFGSPPLDGKVYSQPFVVEQAVLFANREHMAKAGVELPAERFPSWGEQAAAFKKLQRAGITPVMMGASDGSNTDKWIQAFELEHMDRRTELGELTIGASNVNEDVAYLWIERLAEMRDAGYLNPDAADLTEQQATDRFLNGEGGFMMMTPAPIFQQEGADETYDVLGYQQGPGKLSIPVAVSGDCLMITSYGDAQEAAGKLLEYLTKPAQLARFHRTTGELPCSKDFDAAQLDALQRKTWEIISQADPQPFWPHNYIPFEHFDIQFKIVPALVGGRSAAETREEYDSRLADFRERNSGQIKLYERYLNELKSGGF